MAQIKGNEKWQRMLRAACSLALVIWLAWLTAETFWLFFSGPSKTVSLDRSMVRLESSSGPSRSSAAGVEQVQNWELFGPLQAEQQQVSEAPETRLRLELLGVFENTDPKMASAIIAEQGKDSDVYQAGDKVPGNATLEEVYADRVILLRMGQREALKLKDMNLGSGVVETSSRAGQDEPQQEQATSGDVAELSQQRDMIIARLSLQPASSGGYVIGPGAPDQILQVVGLRAGDVLITVNGFDLGSEEADIAALQQFRDTGAASIVVQRGAQRFTVNYPP